ncbi:MAG: Na/Pi cotransporter family protein [Clostridia bacterium]|nr:Na/Pi cotransporter family protein [Clostridia bacterium]
MISEIMLFLGGIAVFSLGLRFIGENFGSAAGDRVSLSIKKTTENPFAAILFGVGTTALAQSSVAIDMAVVSLVDAGAVSFLSACAVVIGANVGTTVTAQLVSFSFSAFSVTAIGSLVCFSGFLLSNFKGRRSRAAGDIMIGFGLIFIGIEIMTETINLFYDSKIFIALFSAKSLPIMLLNGIIVTAICQSSSVVSSILVILAADGKVDFSGAVFFMLGANIGSCFAVINASKNKGIVSRRVALFNLIFNFFGAIIFAAAYCVSKDTFVKIFTGGANVSRAIANFHTFFNTASALAAFPFLKPLCSLTVKLMPEKSKTGRLKRQNRAYSIDNRALL